MHLAVISSVLLFGGGELAVVARRLAPTRADQVELLSGGMLATGLMLIGLGLRLPISWS